MPVVPWLCAALAALACPPPVGASRAAAGARRGGGLRPGAAAEGPPWAREAARAPPEVAQFAAQSAGLATCDVFAQGPVCSSGRRHLLIPGAVQAGLVGHWTFDEDAPYDSSGHGNHGASDIFHGPSPAGGGSSALFQQSFLVVPHTASLQLSDFSYTFWVYPFEDVATLGRDAPSRCPLLRKGAYLPRVGEYANAPAVLFNYRTGQLRASVTTMAAARGDGEFVDSSARLARGRWAHLALVHHGARQSLLLYVNGILDSTLRLQGALMQNEYPLYVGGDPFTVNDCKHGVYMDELRVFKRAVAPHELQAEAAPALAGADPSFVRLGCLSCSLQEAVRACPRGSHVCSSLELHTGGYEAARSLGWLAAGAHVWTEAAAAKARSLAFVDAGSTQGLGLCCRSAP